jgi:hypothetical protein
MCGGTEFIKSLTKEFLCWLQTDLELMVAFQKNCMLSYYC